MDEKGVEGAAITASVLTRYALKFSFREFLVQSFLTLDNLEITNEHFKPNNGHANSSSTRASLLLFRDKSLFNN